MPLIAFAAAAAGAGSASAETLTFEDLATADGGNFALVPSGYGGIQTWTNFYSLNTSYWPTFYNAPVSGVGVLFFGGGTSTLSNATAFTVNDFYIAATNFTSGDDPLSIYSDDYTFKAYNGATLVDSATMTIGTTSTDVVLNWSGITSFTITDYYHGTTSPAYYGLDNLTLNEASVPEPTTAALMGVGLVGLLRARRRKALQAQ